MYAASLFFAENKFRPSLRVHTYQRKSVHSRTFRQDKNIQFYEKFPFFFSFRCRLNLLIPMALHFASLFAGHYCGVLYVAHNPHRIESGLLVRIICKVRAGVGNLQRVRSRNGCFTDIRGRSQYAAAICLNSSESRGY